MRRKFITNLILLLSLNFLIKPFWVFGIDRTVQNVVGPGEYGFYFAVFNFAFILQIILDMGITNFNNRNIAQNNQLLTKHFSGIIILRFLFAAIYLVLIMGVGWIIGYSHRQLLLLLIVGFNQFLLALILYLRSNISALLLFKIDSFLSVLDRLFMIIICSILLWGNIPGFKFSIEWFVYAQTISYISTATIAFLVVLSKTQHLKLNWNFSFFMMIVRKSAPYALLIFLMSMYNRIDGFLLERLLPDGNIQAGIYASAFRLLDVANNMSGVLFAVLLLPIFSKMIKQKKDLSQMVKLPFTLLTMVSITVAAVAVFYGHQIMSFLYHQYSNESEFAYLLRMDITAHVFLVLMFVYIATSITYVFGTLLTANGSLSLLNKVAALGVAISLGLNFLLIPKMASLGSAFAALSAQWVTALLQLYFAFKFLKIKFDNPFLLKLGGFIILAFVFGFLAQLLPVEWKIQFFMMLVAILMSAFGLKLINIPALIGIIRNEE